LDVGEASAFPRRRGNFLKEGEEEEEEEGEEEETERGFMKRALEYFVQKNLKEKREKFAVVCDTFIGSYSYHWITLFFSFENKDKEEWGEEEGQEGHWAVGVIDFSQDKRLLKRAWKEAREMLLIVENERERLRFV